ncbi:hypothetical protein [Streptomyces sp. NPDC094031]|uniref:hypothetical protein n=1 Tax=Streptomyces sp. NPDC094031 TaxID=3155307 RepID=UPI0033329E86
MIGRAGLRSPRASEYRHPPQTPEVLDLLGVGEQGKNLVQVQGAPVGDFQVFRAEGAVEAEPGGDASGDGRVDQHHVDAGPLGAP